VICPIHYQRTSGRQRTLSPLRSTPGCHAISERAPTVTLANRFLFGALSKLRFFALSALLNVHQGTACGIHRNDEPKLQLFFKRGWLVGKSILREASVRSLMQQLDRVRKSSPTPYASLGVFFDSLLQLQERNKLTTVTNITQVIRHSPLLIELLLIELCNIQVASFRALAYSVATRFRVGSVSRNIDQA
jgi:hypothetical protein